MSALFYVWDPKQHNPETTISTLEQAEYFATHSQEIGLSENLKSWLFNVEQIVTTSELSENFDEEIIQFFSDVKGFFNFSTNVFVIEYLQEKSKYLYKILVETLRKHNLVAFDAKHYVFFSRDVIFPDQEKIEQMLNNIQAVTQQQLEQFQAIPPTPDKLNIFYKKWLEDNKDILGFSAIKKDDVFQIDGPQREFDEQIREVIRISCSTKKNFLAYIHVSMITYIKVSSDIVFKIVRDHKINNYTLLYKPDLHGVEGEASHLSDPKQLQYLFEQIYDFLIYDAEKHKDLEILNQWFNHEEEKEYITGLGAISRLILAKYIKDPLYDELVKEALPYVNKERFFRNMSLEEFHQRLDEEIKINLGE